MELKKRNLTIGELVDSQEKLNEKALKEEDWKKALSIEDFQCAALFEGAEYGESTPWKWWKKYQGDAANIDYWNLKIEAIDILHFMLSVLSINENYKNHKDKVVGLKEGDEYIESLIVDDLTKGYKRVNRAVLVKCFRKLLSPTTTVDDLNYFLCCSGLEAAEITAIYAAKYRLNQIRWEQDYGGSYKKVKNGIEDNQLLKDVVDIYLSNKKLVIKDIFDMVDSIFKGEN